jgi:hypothetical protein
MINRVNRRDGNMACFTNDMGRKDAGRHDGLRQCFGLIRDPTLLSPVRMSLWHNRASGWDRLVFGVRLERGCNAIVPSMRSGSIRDGQPSLNEANGEGNVPRGTLGGMRDERQEESKSRSRIKSRNKRRRRSTSTRRKLCGYSSCAPSYHPLSRPKGNGINGGCRR